MIAVLFSAWIAAGAAAPAVKPLRTLVYATEYDVTTTHQRHLSGLGDGVHPGVTVGAATQERVYTVANKARLRIDVVAIADDGIVFDTTLTDGDRTQPAIRVAVSNDGLVQVSPAADLSPEARELMPLLARGLLADRDVRAGASWRATEAPPNRGETRTTVVRADDDSAELRIERDRVLAAGAVTEHAVVSAAYLRKMLDPRTYALEATIRREVGIGASETARIRYTATLVSDTFAK